MESEVKAANAEVKVAGAVTEEKKDIGSKAETEKKDVRTKAKRATKAVKDSASKTKDAAKAAVKRTNAGLKAAREEAKKSHTSRTVKSEVHLQFSGKSYATEDLIKIARDVWQYDLGKDPAEFKSVELYVKPAENLTYYVINGNVTGSFFI